MKYYQGVLLIRAPDFVHRQIDGYPFKPQRPRRSTPDMAPSSASAGTEGARRYVTFTTGLSIVENVKFRSVPVEGAVSGAGNTRN
jgi:hypothetical protein